MSSSSALVWLWLRDNTKHTDDINHQRGCGQQNHSEDCRGHSKRGKEGLWSALNLPLLSIDEAEQRF